MRCAVHYVNHTAPAPDAQLQPQCIDVVPRAQMALPHLLPCVQSVFVHIHSCNAHKVRACSRKHTFFFIPVPMLSGRALPAGDVRLRPQLQQQEAAHLR